MWNVGLLEIWSFGSWNAVGFTAITECHCLLYLQTTLTMIQERYNEEQREAERQQQFQSLEKELSTVSNDNKYDGDILDEGYLFQMRPFEIQPVQFMPTF